MRPGSFSRPDSSPEVFGGLASPLAPFALLLIFVLCLAGAFPVLAQDDLDSRRAAAQDQFARAEMQGVALESKAERERSVKDYESLVQAYRRVYLITPNAAEVPPAIKEVADLYRHMGEQFEPKYFESAIQSYEFLAHDYPQSSLREQCLLAIADIRRNNLSKTDPSQIDAAKQNYEDFLQQYPRSSLAAQARKAIAEIEAAQAEAKANAARERAAAAAVAAKSPVAPAAAAATSAAVTPASMAKAPAATPAIAATPASDGASAGDNSTPGQGSEVSRVRVWNADNYTRIIIELGGKAKYQAARISDPDRIYFDLENAHLSSDLLHQPIEVPAGSYLKSVRVAQNRADVVRVVLDVAKVKDYSVFELADPDRLVVDVYGPGTNSGAISAANGATTPSSGAASGPNSAARPETRPAAPLSTAAARPAAAPRPVIGVLPLTATLDFPLALTPPAAEVNPRASAAAPESLKAMANSIGPAPAAKPMRSGEQSLTRALGLKIGRIVIDPGHGGHDTGTIGPTGLMEKDLCLDVALRLGKLIEESIPTAKIVYTRQSDKYVALEQRTAIANDAKADLFISIHANSSDDPKVGGIETYYLNFNASEQGMEVAARENATAQSSVHDLQDLVTKIARNEKIEESRDLAADIQDSLAGSMQIGTRTERNRGVRKAPFVVLVGADMPSVLSEISFISNPADEQLLKKPENRQRAAEGLFDGIVKYLRSVNSLSTTITPVEETSRPQ